MPYSKLKILKLRKMLLLERLRELENEQAELSDFENPFVISHFIEQAEKFIGRKTETTQIRSYLDTHSCVSIIGDRRIGKSSLLYHIFQTAKEQMQANQYNYTLVYLSMQDASLNSPYLFARKLLRLLKLKPDNNMLKESPMAELTEQLEIFHEQGNMPIILIDEFERIADKPELFTKDFFSHIRFPADKHYVTYITASKHYIKDIFQYGGLSSSFWNLFNVIELNTWTKTELHDFVQKYWLPLHPNTKERTLISRYASLHPLKMQLFSFHLLLNRKNKYPEKQLIHEIEKQLAARYSNTQDAKLTANNFIVL